jgi:cytochrome c2
MKTAAYFLVGLLILAAALGLGWWRQRALVEEGRGLAQDNCAACHDLSQGGRNATGPYLGGVFNRPAGSVAGFDYSQAFRRAVAEDPFSWTEATLDRFIVRPDQVVPGTAMGAATDAGAPASDHGRAFEGIQDLHQRRALIAFLRSLE